jgi:hypothetical protein
MLIEGGIRMPSVPPAANRPVARRLHLRDERRRERRRIGGAGAGEGGEDGAGQHGDMAEPAPDMAHEGTKQPHQRLHHPRAGHQLRHEDVERDGDEGEVADRADEGMRRGVQRLARRHQPDEGRAADRDEDRDAARQQQCEQHAHHDQWRHAPPSCPRSARTRRMAE